MDVFSWQVSAFEWDDLRQLVPLAIAGVIVWALWLYRVVLSRRYRPVENSFRATTSVVVPSFHEDVPILMRCLETWREQNPNEIIIVLDVADLEAYEQITALGDPRVTPILFKHAGKRSALGIGIARAKFDILVLVDSDTSWTPGLLDAVQMPFADPEVGAVSTQQNVFDRTSSIWRRVADWLVNLRYYDYVPAMSTGGAVACVSGRTGVYRRSAVLPVLENLENEFFLGRRCVAGDDGRLTWLILGSGFKTVHQSSAKAISMFPTGLRAFTKQRIRWSRNSYRTYLTAIYKGWLWRVPFVTKITVLQILLTPVTMGVTIGYLLFSRVQLEVLSILFAIGWMLISRGVRGFSHLRRHPQEILLLPVLALVVIFIALPIKLYAFFTMNKQGWLTRNANSVGGEGQTSNDAGPRAARRPVPTPVPVRSDPAKLPAWAAQHEADTVFVEPVRSGVRSGSGESTTALPRVSSPADVQLTTPLQAVRQAFARPRRQAPEPVGAAPSGRHPAPAPLHQGGPPRSGGPQPPLPTQAPPGGAPVLPRRMPGASGGRQNGDQR